LWRGKLAKREGSPAEWGRKADEGTVVAVATRRFRAGPGGQEGGKVDGRQQVSRALIYSGPPAQNARDQVTPGNITGAGQPGNCGWGLGPVCEETAAHSRV